MIGIIFSSLIGLLIYFNPIDQKSIANLPLLTVFLVTTAFLLTIVQVLTTLFAWRSLQYGEERHSPRLIETFMSDRLLLIANSLLLLFFLFTYLVVADFLVTNYFNPTVLLIIWTLALGAAIDLLHFVFKRVQYFLDPFFVVGQTVKRAAHSIRQEEKVEILQWVDVLTETALKSIGHNQISLAQEALDGIKQTTATFIEAAKSIGHHLEESSDDLIGYTLYYISQRLEMVFNAAVEKKLDPLVGGIISLFGKIALEASKLDITLTTNPLSIMGKLAQKAQRHEMEEVAGRAQLTFVEIGRILTQERDITYQEIKDPFLIMIKTMKEIAKETFRTDKSLGIALLTAPFEQMKGFFSQGKAAEHQDKDLIVNALNAVLEEFAALQEVLQTLPDLQKMVQNPPESEEL